MSEKLTNEIKRNELNDEVLDNVSGGNALADYDEHFKLAKCPSFEWSAYVYGILNNPRASGTAKSAIKAEEGRCNKCVKNKSCTLSNEEKIKYGGLAFWNGKL